MVTKAATYGPHGKGLDTVTVLVVDDNQNWTWATAELLQQETGFEVENAHSLEAARNKFDYLNPDCVICDYELGDGHGLALLDAVRRIEPDLPFLLITGKGNEGLASKAIRRGVSDYIEKGCENEEELLVNRVETLVRASRSERALKQQRQMKTAVLDILRETASGTDLCREFCDQLAQNQHYGLAWIGTTSTESELLPRTSAGREEYLDQIGHEGHLPASEPSNVAWQNSETVFAPIEKAARTKDWEVKAADNGFEGVIAVPIQYEGVNFGILSVYLVASTDIETHMDLIEEYAKSVGYALQSLDQKRSLLSSQPVQVELVVNDTEAPMVKLAERIQSLGSIYIPSVISRSNDTTVYFCLFEETAEEAIESAIATSPDLSLLNLEARSDRIKCAITAPGPTPEETLVSNGAKFGKTNVRDGSARVTAYLHEDKHIGQIATAVENHFSDVSVSAVWTTEQTVDVESDPFSDLTERQEEILRHTFHEGYFEQPREANATEIADRIGISRQTFAQHLRAAQRKVFGNWQSNGPS